MLSSGAQAASFIPILYDTMKSNNLSISLTCCDNTGWPTTLTTGAALVAAGMEEYLTVITSHMYTGDPNSVLSTKLKVWQTEGADLNDAWSTTWYSSGAAFEGMTWANKIATGILNANLSAYLYWEGLEVNEQVASSYLVLSDGTTATPSGRLWAFAMWSRFVRPGAFRVSIAGAISGVAIGAFKNTDGSVVSVLTNSGSSAQSIALAFSGFSPSAASAYLTDNTVQVGATTVTLSGGEATVSVPAQSVVTIVLTAGGKVSSSSSTTSVSSTTSAKPTTSTSSIATSPTITYPPTSTATQTKYGQCGGSGYTGPTACAAPAACITSNPYYAQCL